MKYPLLLASLLCLMPLTGCGGDYWPVTEPPANDPEPSEDPAAVLPAALVVCPSCPADLLAAKTAGILRAMGDLVAFAGSDALPGLAPATFHLEGDSECGQYQIGMTGYFHTDAAGHAHVCLFDVEKQNRSLPFTAENASRPEDQLLPAHEAVHAWSAGRIGNYAIEEPFCKITSFIISGALNGTDPDPCGWFTSAIGYPDRLMYDLCGLGMDAGKASQTLKLTAAAVNAGSGQVTSAEFVAIVSAVLGRDATPAFRAAGILP